MANQKTNPDNDFQLLPIRLAGQHCAKPINFGSQGANQ